MRAAAWRALADTARQAVAGPDGRDADRTAGPVGIMNLRPYQEDAVRRVREAFGSGVRSVCLTAPCGAGKTVMFSEISRLAHKRGTHVGILVHRDSLLTQAAEKLREFGVQHGIISPGYGNYGDNINVCSVQTLVRRLDRYKFDLLVADEGHHATSPTYEKIFAAFPEAKILGVTATPERTDGRGLDSVYQKLVLGPSIADLIRDGYLVEPITYGPIHKLDLSGIGSKMGDYDQRQLAAHMDTPRITADAITHYSKVCPGVPAIAFCVNVKHAEDVTAAFLAAGYRAALVHGKLDLTTIRARISGLTDGSVQVLVAVDLISEGTDVPAVVCAINLRATKSKGLHIQQGGRALRPIYAPGFDLNTRAGRLAAIAASSKPKAIILDHAANCLRHMTVDEPHEWTLEGRKKRQGKGGAAVPIRQCVKCFATHKPAPKCPVCGHVYEVATEVPEVVAGDLSPIDKAALRRAKSREEWSCRSMAELTALGKKRNYSNPGGWAFHKWQARQAQAAQGEGFFS